MAGSLPAQVVGDWAGTLTAGAVELALVLHVTETDSGLAATMDSPDQGAYGIPASSVTVTGDSATIQFAGVGGAFQGQMLDEDSLSGSWTQAGQTFPLELVRTEGGQPEARRPQEPTEPLPYVTEDVVFPNAEAGIGLAGTLTLPDGPGPHPAVVLISGSGPQNRDEEVFRHKPFLVLADHLTRQGIVVLRYDDRGVGESGGTFATATTADFATDAEAGLRYLDGREEIDSSRVGLIGHSEGGVIAPLVASRSDAVAFVVMIAGPGIRADSLLLLQAEAINRGAGATEAQIATNREMQNRLFAAAISDATDAELDAEVRRIFSELAPSITGVSLDAQVASVTSPWMRWFLRYDPEPALRGLDVPVLAVNGSNDLQVLAEPNLSAIRTALTAGGNEDFTTIELEGLNHLLQTSATGMVAEYGQIEETMAPLALETIGDWIARRFVGS
ncbi:MAG: alpha/beta hydrolase [Gemmatimonadales bacterium]|nr:MAG: alpha/beta hydrolase [Gemmatimonadales bacterium]